MGVHDWARQALTTELQAAEGNGFDEAMALRALLSAIVERSKSVRSIDDLAQELQFLADNLDDGRDYAFMRP
ncbi:hypothetical protein [Pseudomonas indica]|jgi:hypothetical protein|uniref:Uncharacterized protein n=1 Tax=Pseudomonas indica TaxID=137658 RepID=A0A1G9M8Y8_9PSED|nr:hypothetical protein [Pseudomonas indica]SDL70441.1 hypothetical protein SAMN05216186_12817 [Pseudomonas indica]